MAELLFPENYRPALGVHDTQVAIKIIKDNFQMMLGERLHLLRVSAPLFVDPASGLNDNLNGVERPVGFDMLHEPQRRAEVVHSLAKWKRYALKKYDFPTGQGLYTDMSAIRRDEIPDNIHSIYVDQWDWEKSITKEQRTPEYFEETVRKIYRVLQKTEEYLHVVYSFIDPVLPKEIFFITSEELLQRYPDKDPKEREYLITKEYGAVCITQIGGKLSNGEKHDGRAPDYDDWQLNGDILVYYPVLDIALELSSMGIRVDETSLVRQLEEAGCMDRLCLPFQQAVLNKEVPYTVGGGIGQSRICMFYLRKAHIGEVQCSIWPEEMIEECAKHNIELL